MTSSATITEVTEVTERAPSEVLTPIENIWQSTHTICSYRDDPSSSHSLFQSQLMNTAKARNRMTTTSKTTAPKRNLNFPSTSFFVMADSTRLIYGLSVRLVADRNLKYPAAVRKVTVALLGPGLPMTRKRRKKGKQRKKGEQRKKGRQMKKRRKAKIKQYDVFSIIVMWIVSCSTAFERGRLGLLNSH